LLGAEVIIPDFLEQSAFFSQDVLMRASMGCVESLNIDPIVPMVNQQDNSKGYESPGDCISINPDDCLGVD
jgi:hypothetical protein